MDKVDLEKIAKETFSIVEKVRIDGEKNLEEFIKNISEITKTVLQKKNVVDKTPRQNKKKAKPNQVLVEVTNENEPIRPVRTAARKALNELKERPLKGKLRKEVKSERTSDEYNENDQNQTEKTSEIKKEKTSLEKKGTKSKDVANDEQIQEAPPGIDTESYSKKVDDSVQILPAKSISLVEVSDDDDDDAVADSVFVMPKPPASKNRQKKQRSGQISDYSSSIDSTVKSEGSSRVTRSKKRQPVITMKKEPVPVDREKSLESIYEDAISSDLRSMPDSESDKLYRSVVVIEKMNFPNVEQNENATLQIINVQSEATFISPVNTFVVTKGSEATAAMAAAAAAAPVNNDATFNVPPSTSSSNEISNETIIIEKEKPVQRQSSLLTEDDSIEIEPMKKPEKNLPNKKKELFNPCVESPLRKKIAAFEKHAEALQNSNNRPTRPRTRQRKESKENNADDVVTKVSTPVASRIATAMSSSISTPNLIGKKATNHSLGSASRLAQLKKTNSVTKMPREPSTDDKRRGQLLLDEKKKRNEEKMRQAQLAREAMEKEKLDKYKKMMQEKEEKVQEAYRKKMQQKKQQEDYQKQKEQRREEYQRELREQQRQLELAEAARRDRENIDNLRIMAEKNALQAKLKQNEMKNKKNQILLNDYMFENICTDDSTDDESKTSSKGAPPSWSTSSHRKEQIIMQSMQSIAIVDCLFSVAPTTPDLQEIFPTIDPRYLKRNSSAVWSTPPRYSQLPKY